MNFKKNSKMQQVQIHKTHKIVAKLINILNWRKKFGQLDFFKKWSTTLDALYHALTTTRPTSTASERVFSTASSIKTKRRISLNFETFNSLLFLKYVFRKKIFKRII